MHHLFQLVLEQKDLSRAGDLFSLDNFEIEGSLSEALNKIKLISTSPDYQSNDNDQAVIEICITRITTAIRETDSIEKHGKALVSLWESCLEHNLKPATKDEDTPHAKIASDIMSCILQNYNRPSIMSLAVPVAIRFLQRGNKELCRNMSSYISLVAIAKADLLADHTETIIKSILQGNSMLLRVLPSVYEMQPQPIHKFLKDLVSQMSYLEEGEQHHMLRLLQAIAKAKQPEVLSETVPVLTEYLSDPSYSEIVVNILLDISSYEPLTLAGSLSALKGIGEHFPCLIGQIAKIYGAVGRVDEEMARTCLTYLVNQLNNMEHSFHHILLMEIRNITSVFNEILGIQGRDMYRMSNSLTAIAKILNEYLTQETLPACGKEINIPKESSLYVPDTHQSSFHVGKGEEKMEIDNENVGNQKDPTSSSSPVLKENSKLSGEDRKDSAVSGSKHLALNSSSRKCLNLDSRQDTEYNDVLGLITFSQLFLNQDDERLPSGLDILNSQVNRTSCLDPLRNCTETKGETEPNQENQSALNTFKEAQNEHDELFLHLKENMSKLKIYVTEMGKKIPVPDQCVIEDTFKTCVAKLFFSCPMKAHYCLYSKSSFILISRHPQIWIHIMFLFQQSLFSEPLSTQTTSMQVLKTLWEKTQLKGTQSFEASITQSLFPHKKDLDLIHTHLEEVRFFDLFGYSEETGSWLCFMCNNPEKATVLNQEGQPLIEGRLKEKQVRWKFIKRWKTRYFTLAGNQLLFRKGKCKDDPDDCPIELSKVQSVKAVAKKRRDRSLPRAFEIFTDNKTYVFKAKDEKNAEEWLQCINVAVAQAKERESREATTYL
ncbi:ventricular zone-expressed PH domain-containing protein homolog 1 isoform X2 [Hyla sarda]|uniref:ventricular zone-expressed PH domain-containing protein homolog 1 isoform X2 n=1 Tax=Hyla sarda TaxID=327740 RepID=UPI0024C3C54E|nr:ventricular zone-expressed PH domain-containing protein homolog 1 isoform X2 [Hyla sarda]